MNLAKEYIDDDDKEKEVETCWIIITADHFLACLGAESNRLSMGPGISFQKRLPN
jgi:hypothetical protein